MPQLVACRARGRGQGNGREEGRSGGTNIGICCFQAVFGGQNIRSLLQQTGRGSNRNGCKVHLCQGGRQIQATGQAGAQQQGQGIAVLMYLTLVLGGADAGTFQRGPTLRQFHVGGGTEFELLLRQLIAFLLGIECGLAQRQQLLIGHQGQISGCHRGHQGDLGAALGFDLSQIGFQSLIFQALYPSEQIQLVGSDPHLGTVLGTDLLCAGTVQVARGLLATATGANRQRWQLGRTLDTVLRLVALYIQGCQPQIAVVLQRAADQALQRGIAELLLPAEVGFGVAADLPGGALRHLGSLIVRRHRATGE